MPRRRRIHGGTVLASPTVSAKRDNPLPACDHVHDISVIMEGSTTPSELKVAPEIMKKMALITANKAHFSTAGIAPGRAAAGLCCTGELHFPCRDPFDLSYEIAQDASRQSFAYRGEAGSHDGRATEGRTLLLGFAAPRSCTPGRHAGGFPRRPGADGHELAAARDADQPAPAFLRAAHLHRQRHDAARRRGSGDRVRSRSPDANSAQRPPLRRTSRHRG